MTSFFDNLCTLCQQNLASDHMDSPVRHCPVEVVVPPFKVQVVGQRTLQVEHDVSLAWLPKALIRELRQVSVPHQVQVVKEKRVVTKVCNEA